LYLTGRITEDQWQDMKNKYKSGNAATDTTVATKPTYTGGGGGKIMVKY
jgi:hypothetical protein